MYYINNSYFYYYYCCCLLINTDIFVIGIIIILKCIVINTHFTNICIYILTTKCLVKFHLKEQYVSTFY